VYTYFKVWISSVLFWDALAWKTFSGRELSLMKTSKPVKMSTCRH